MNSLKQIVSKTRLDKIRNTDIRKEYDAKDCGMGIKKNKRMGSGY